MLYRKQQCYMSGIKDSKKLRTWKNIPKKQMAEALNVDQETISIDV